MKTPSFTCEALEGSRAALLVRAAFRLNWKTLWDHHYNTTLMAFIAINTLLYTNDVRGTGECPAE